MTDITPDCQRVISDGLDELYVAGRLQDERLEAFEQHYFGCSACFERVARLHATRAHLDADADRPATAPGHRRGRAGPRWVAAAGVAACLGAAIWLAPRSVPLAEEPAAVAAPAPAALAQVQTLPPFEPPPYRPQTLRGAADDAGAQFRTAMALYSQRRFADAIPGLARAADQRVDAAFFLAACRLLTGDASGAAAAARQAVTFGDTPYLEEARLVLARALVRLDDVEAARAELTRVVALRGDRVGEATALLQHLDHRR